ncbi:Putative beta-lactamase HcpC (Cysteine-rich protein C) [Durusdinium trenchii]|uniref:Beta-lactamase HcpC (Cysteine-rich protein C) n=1 Tax=Durusdinium trenchii TaxID=1381693 RepID=A0ABP0KAB9_9DINO
MLLSAGFAEQWPKMEESEEEFPRNVAVFRLKDALEKYLEEAQSAAQSLKGNLVNPTADCVELISEDYSLAEHGSLLREDDRPQCIAFADRVSSCQACEEIFEDLFARPIPREAGGFLVAPERTLAVSVSVDEAPPLGTTMVLNWAQRRYFLNWAGEQEGVLQIRLTPDEGKKLQQRDEESSEALAGDACRIFDLPEGSVCGLALFAADVADRPSYTRFPGVEAEEEPLVAFLLGGPRCSGLGKHLGVPSITVGLGLGQCIDSGLRNDGPQAEDTVLGRLEATLKQLRKHPQRWPPCVQDTLPALQQQLLSRSVSARCWRAMAASGPWPDPAKEEAEKTVAEAEAAAYDFGGATEQGLQAAKSLEDQADLGSAESMFQLGVMYVTANGVDKDMSKAFHWIQKAADLEHLEAQNCVGTMLRNGLGVEIRKEEAAQWFEKAGARGHAEAQFNLGEMCLDGRQRKRRVPRPWDHAVPFAVSLVLDLTFFVL